MRFGLRINPPYYEKIPIRDLVEGLAEAGAGAVEYGIWPGDPTWGRRNELVGAARDAGLHVQFHSRFRPEIFGTNDWEKAGNEHLFILAWYAEQAIEGGGETVDVAIHPASRPEARTEADFGGLRDGGVAFFRWILNEVKARAYPLRPNLENIYNDPGAHWYGRTYTELLDVRRRVGKERLRFTWDLGHSRMSDQYFDVEPIPRCFVEAVASTHVHDLGYDQEAGRYIDHQVPVKGIVPFDKYFGALKAVGFSGSLILEMGAGMKREGMVLDRIQKALAAVRKAWNKAEPAVSFPISDISPLKPQGRGAKPKKAAGKKRRSRKGTTRPRKGTEREIDEKLR